MERFRFPFVFRFRIRLGFRFRFRFKWMRSECVWVQVRVRVLAFRAIYSCSIEFYAIFSVICIDWNMTNGLIELPPPPALPLSLSLSLYLCTATEFILLFTFEWFTNDSRVESSRNLIRFSTCSNGETINKALDKCPSTLSLSLSLSPPSLSVSLSILDYFLIVFEANTDWRLTGWRVPGSFCSFSDCRSAARGPINCQTPKWGGFVRMYVCIYVCVCVCAVGRSVNRRKLHATIAQLLPFFITLVFSILNTLLWSSKAAKTL